MIKLSVTTEQLIAAAKSISKFRPKNGIIEFLPNKATATLLNKKLRTNRIEFAKSQEVKTLFGKLKAKLFPKKAWNYEKFYKDMEWFPTNRKESAISLPRSAIKGKSKEYQAILVAHEAAEAKYAKKPNVDFINTYHHASPGVLLNEHNNLTTLNASKDKVDKIIQDLAGLRGYYNAVKTPNNLNFSHGRSQRLSRHAIKRIIEMNK